MNRNLTVTLVSSFILLIIVISIINWQLDVKNLEIKDLSFEDFRNIVLGGIPLIGIPFLINSHVIKTASLGLSNEIEVLKILNDQLKETEGRFKSLDNNSIQDFSINLHEFDASEIWTKLFSSKEYPELIKTSKIIINVYFTSSFFRNIEFKEILRDNIYANFSLDQLVFIYLVTNVLEHGTDMLTYKEKNVFKRFFNKIKSNRLLFHNQNQEHLLFLELKRLNKQSLMSDLHFGIVKSIKSEFKKLPKTVL